MELKINETHVIDDVECVSEKMEDIVKGQFCVLDMLAYVRGEKNTIFYFDEYMNEVSENDARIKYALIDTGYTSQVENHPIFIAMVKRDTGYYGHLAGTEYSIAARIIKSNGAFKYSLHNIEKFMKNYDDKISQRKRKHIDCLAPKMNDEVFWDLCAEIYTDMLFPIWKSVRGLDNFMSMIGRRIEQLMDSGKSEYYVRNEKDCVIVNTGILNCSGEDYLVAFKYEERYKRYTEYKIISGRENYISLGFTENQAATIIKPIQFADDNTRFEATIESFDINWKSLLRTVDKNRYALSATLQAETSHKIAIKLMESLQLGLKIQQRDPSYAKLLYSDSDGTLSWILPLHINNKITQEPELVMVIRKDTLYEIKSILPYDEDLKDQITVMSMYGQLW